MIRVCRSVRMMCDGGEPLTYPFYASVEVGKEFVFGSIVCRVAYCSPSPCVIVPTTDVTFEDMVHVRTYGLERNIRVDLKFSSGHVEHYIYPRKVWDEVRRRFIEPLSSGYPPREVGAILHGPPGTGKTSMTEILALHLGLRVVNVTSESVLSKYVGEAEKNLAKKMEEAERVEPSVLLMDDAEWLAMRRDRAGGEDARTYVGMMSVLLRKIQDWSRARRRIIALLTTNISISNIDLALRRSGRLGRPIFVPLPDFEAVKVLMECYGINSSVAEKYAIKVVNSGLPMSDVMTIIHDLMDGKEPRIEPVEGQGYTRFVPPSLSEGCASWVKREFGDICVGMKAGARLWLPIASTVGIPLAVSLVGLVCRKPVIVLNDQRNIDDAITTARTSEAVLIVDTELIPPDYLRFIASKARGGVPVFYVGKDRPEVISMPIGANFESAVARRAVLEIVAKFYGVDVSEKDLRDAERLSTDAWRRVVEFMGVFRAPPSVIRRRLAPVG